MLHKFKNISCLLTMSLALAGCNNSIFSGITPNDKVADDAETREIISTEKLRQKDPQALLGAREHPELTKNFGGVYKNSAIERQLALIVGKLVAQSQDPLRGYSVTILDSSSINAFALPGGYLYITRGVLALANDQSEVAAVLAHEMSHVVQGHGVQRAEKAKVSEIIGQVANEVLTNETAAKIAEAANELKLAKFSRHQEFEADASGIKLLASAGYDPMAAPRFLNAMTGFANYQSTFERNSNIEDFFASHPSNPARIEKAKAKANPYLNGQKYIVGRGAYLPAINGMAFGEYSETGFIRANQFIDKTNRFAFKTPTRFEMEYIDGVVTATGPNAIALRFDKTIVDEELILDNYIRSGWINGLEDSSVRPFSASGLRGLKAYAKAGGWHFAIRLLRDGKNVYRFIVAAPKNSDDLENAANRIAKSFQKLSSIEASKIKPLKLKTIRVKSSDSLASLANKMKGTKHRLALFRALNALSKGEAIKAGTLVKVVTN